MKYPQTHSFFLLTIAFIINFTAYSQKNGNLVEYFGKDRALSTREGQVETVFRKGLVLQEAIKPGLLTGNDDIIAWKIATGSFNTPEPNQIVVASWTDKTDTLRWKEAAADSNGLFSENLSRSYLFAHYEAQTDTVLLLDAAGHTRVFINGFPHEGDHYDFGYTLIPFKAAKGTNSFLFSYGRFSRLKAKLILPAKPVQFTKRDLLLPTFLKKESGLKFGAVRVINASEKPLLNYQILCVTASGDSAVVMMDNIVELATRKVKFVVKTPQNIENEVVKASLFLRDTEGVVLDTMNISIKVQSVSQHHERTFLSGIDGSVQYYSIAPSLNRDTEQALVLSTHGASVEATNQTRAYKQKDWANIVAPTNRRPFGFNWEEWGRVDALEVLSDAKRFYPTDEQRVYITGHSMGGHGSWFLGSTYPSLFAAVAPAASYPDIITYRRDPIDQMKLEQPHFQMIYRAASAGRVLNIKQNLLQSGVYILHGDDDQVVPLALAQKMRTELGSFHPNFTYFEYPGGTHWYGDHCMDWPPLFAFLKQNIIPADSSVKKLTFYTATPAVSATNHWIAIHRQINQYQTSSVQAKLTDDTLFVHTSNVECFMLDLKKLNPKQKTLLFLDGKIFTLNLSESEAYFVFSGNNWMNADKPDSYLKNPQRSGGFKFAFNNHLLFVYATKGSRAENDWYLNKARYDAETFLYRGNGSVDIIPDTSFVASAHPDRNVVVYGNASNNAAWQSLLHKSPLVVEDGKILFGDKQLTGGDLGVYFVFPRPDSEIASVGVVAATGNEGLGAIIPNDYFSGITGFPDVLVFRTAWLKNGVESIAISGFFGNDWSIENGDFAVTE